jgi:hypothetical protein
MGLQKSVLRDQVRVDVLPGLQAMNDPPGQIVVFQKDLHVQVHVFFKHGKWYTVYGLRIVFQFNHPGGPLLAKEGTCNRLIWP